MFLGAGQLWDIKMCRQDWVQWRKHRSMGAGCGASVSLEISDHWSGMLDLVHRDSQRATGDCGLGDVGFGHFSLESLESSGP